jgi:hypothetical protein
VTLSGVSHEWAFQKAKHLHFKKRNWVSLKKRKKQETPVGVTPCTPSDQVIPKIMGFMRPRAHYFGNAQALGCHCTQKYLYFPLV